MIKVVQIVFSLESSGSAGLRLHRAFSGTGFQSYIISLKYGSVDNEKIKYLGSKPRLISKLDTYIQSYLVRNTVKEHGSFSYPVLGSNITKEEEIRNADIIYIHWVLGGFLNLSNIEQLAKTGKPLIFVMHDMWTFTGGCHHSFACEKYKKECFDCQIFIKKRKRDLSWREFRKKLKLFTKYQNLHFIAPSKWLYNCARESFLLRDKPVYHIPNIIDSTIFRPCDKNIAKQILGLNTKGRVIGFGAVSISSPYKGWDYLQKALELFKDRNAEEEISVLIFGSGYNEKIANAIPFKTKFLGFLKDEYSMVLIYNAMDVFIVPSLADNLPTTVLESLSCGTPVVGFETGGIPDMIRHKENGYLARYKNSSDLADGIGYCLDNHIKGKLLPTFEKDEILNRHKELISGIMRE